jgi:hypothetical protein
VLTLEKEKEKETWNFLHNMILLYVFKFICVVEGKGVGL